MRTYLVIAALFIALLAAPAAAAGQTRFVRYPDYSEGRLVFSYLGDIWILDNPDAPPRPLTIHEATETRPCFSPDGKWVAFSSNRTGSWDIFVMPSTGGQPKRLTFNSASDSVLGWTNDSGSVIFRSRRDRKYSSSLYKVSLDAKLPELIDCGTAYDAAFDETGRYVALNRHYPRYSRKSYRGSNNADIWIWDSEENKFERLTEFEGHDGSPMIADGEVYFVTDRDGIFNIWKMPLKGGEPEKITEHEEDGVTFASLSRDRKTIVYERGFRIWKLDIASGKYEPFELDLSLDYVENPVVYKNFSTVDDYDVSHDGKRLVISTHGEIFTVPVDEGRIVQITESPWRDRRVVYGPEDKKIAFVSDMTGEEQVYIVNSDGTGLTQLTDTETRKYEVDWSPCASKLSVTESDHSLWVYDVESKKGRQLIKPAPGAPRNIRWSPDGKWLAYVRENDDFWGDIYIISAEEENPEEYPVLERMPYEEYSIYFTPEKIYFLSQVNSDYDLALFSVDLAKHEYDPDDPEGKERAEARKKKEKEKPEPPEDEKEGDEEKEEPDGEKPEEKDEEKPEEPEKPAKKEKKLPEVKIDFDGIEKRLEEIVRVRGDIRGLAVSPDGKRIVLVVSEPRGKDSINILYLVDEKEDKLKQIASLRDIRGLRFSRNGRELYFTSRDHVMRMPATGGSPKPVSFRVPVKIDRAAEYKQIFNECWRAMKYIFYDPDMHGVDWDAMREKYSALLPSITEKSSLGTIVNWMLGELNASHMGFYVNTDDDGGGDSFDTRSPGFEIIPDPDTGMYVVGHIYKKGPADKEWVDVKEGDYIISIDGEELKYPDNFCPFLNHPLNERVDIVVSSDPEGSEKRTSTVKLASSREINYLEYYEWVDNNRELVDKLSDGKLAYLHIPGMSGTWLERFKREIIEFRLKDGLIIDVRNNGGGNIDQQLLDVLERRMYGRWRTRGSIPGRRPGNGFFGPKVVLINERSFSDAEVFPQGFKDLGLGKLIGLPTGGGVIATSSYRLMDGSSIRTPLQGVYTKEGLNLENYGVKPDFYCEILPLDEINERDPQLELAVKVLLEELVKKEEKGK